MAYGESDGHVTDHVTWLWKVKLVTPISLEPNISKTAGDTVGYPSDSTVLVCFGNSFALFSRFTLIVGL